MHGLVIGSSPLRSNVAPCFTSMSKIRPRKFGHPPKNGRDRSVARITNAEHRDIGLRASTATHIPSPRLTELAEDWNYKRVVSLTEKQRKKVLIDYGILPKNTNHVACWECGDIMSAASSASSAKTTQDTLKCLRCRMPGRHFRELAHASLAWTPWWKARQAGHEPSFCLFLRVCYCIGYRTKKNWFLFQQVLVSMLF